MKKICNYLTFMIFTLLISINGVYASSASISASSKSITKNNAVNVYVTVSSDSPIVSIEGSLSCSGAGVSSGLNLVFDDSSNSVYSKNYSLSIKPTATGTVTCTVSGARLTNMSSGSWIGLNSPSTSITVSEAPKVVQKTYSSDNTLKSLTIEGYQIDFNKDTLEYNLEVENSVTSVKIDAIANDNAASVSGTGEVSVSEGSNKLEVVVTAENGNKKTYIINVTVKELDPVYVNIGKSKYTVIRKEGIIDAPSEYYEKTTIKIGEDEVLAYYNKTTKITLVALKDDKDNINYYIYKNNKYTLYKEYNFGSIILYIIDSKNKIPDGYFASKFKFNGEKIKGYKLDGDSEYYLVYAMNVQTGEKGLYSYDSKEKTIQRFNDEVSNIYKDKADKYRLLFITISITFAVTLLVILIIYIISKKKKKHKVKPKVDSDEILVKKPHK